MSTKAILNSTKNLTKGLVTLSLTLGAVAPSAFAADTAVASAKAKAPEAVTTQRLQETVTYLQSIPTVGGALVEMHQLGVISKEEETSLEGFATAQKVDLTSAVPKMEVNGLTVKMKTTSLTWMADGSIKTQNGRLLHDSATQAKDAMVIETFKALAEKPGTYSLLDLVLPKADAQAYYPQNPVDDFFGGLIRLGNTIGESLAIPLCSLTVAPTDAALSALRQGINEGQVVCHGGQFGHVGYIGLDERAFQDAQRGRSGPPIGLSREVDASFNAVCQAPFDRNNGAPDNRARFRPASPEVVADAFHGRSPRCTPRNAKILNEYMKGHMRRMDRAIVHHHRGGDDLPPRPDQGGDGLGGDRAQ